jgi:hypothetical protein
MSVAREQLKQGIRVGPANRAHDLAVACAGVAACVAEVSLGSSGVE